MSDSDKHHLRLGPGFQVRSREFVWHRQGPNPCCAVAGGVASGTTQGRCQGILSMCEPSTPRPMWRLVVSTCYWRPIGYRVLGSQTSVCLFLAYRCKLLQMQLSIYYRHSPASSYPLMAFQSVAHRQPRLQEFHALPKAKFPAHPAPLSPCLVTL